jgi:hypothetical protein
MRCVETSWEGETAVIASLRDITERKRAEEALQKAKKRRKPQIKRNPISLPT